MSVLRKIVLFSLLVLAVLPFAHAKVYKWIQPNDKFAFSDQAPQRVELKETWNEWGGDGLETKTVQGYIPSDMTSQKKFFRHRFSHGCCEDDVSMNYKITRVYGSPNQNYEFYLPRFGASDWQVDDDYTPTYNIPQFKQIPTDQTKDYSGWTSNTNPVIQSGAACVEEAEVKSSSLSGSISRINRFKIADAADTGKNIQDCAPTPSPPSSGGQEYEQYIQLDRGTSNYKLPLTYPCKGYTVKVSNIKNFDWNHIKGTHTLSPTSGGYVYSDMDQPNGFRIRINNDSKNRASSIEISIKDHSAEVGGFTWKLRCKNPQTNGDKGRQLCKALGTDWNQTLANKFNNGCGGDDIPSFDDGDNVTDDMQVSYQLGPKRVIYDGTQWTAKNVKCHPSNFEQEFGTCNQTYIKQCGISTATARNCPGQVIELGNNGFASDGNTWFRAGISPPICSRITTGAIDQGKVQGSYLAYRPPNCQSWTWYKDADSDGLPNATHTTQSCNPGSKWTRAAQPADCNDGNQALPTVWYADNDGDTYYNQSNTATTCTAPGSSWTRTPNNQWDCDDTNGTIHSNCGEACTKYNTCSDVTNMQTCQQLNDCNVQSKDQENASHPKLVCRGGSVTCG